MKTKKSKMGSIIFLLTLFISSVDSRFVNMVKKTELKKECTSGSKCDDNECSKFVFCKNFVLSWSDILNHIPSDIAILYIENGTLIKETPVYKSVLSDDVVERKVIQTFPSIEEVHISSVNIQDKLNENTFCPFKNIHTLHLNNNSLDTLDTKVLHCLENLKLLNLSRNNLRELDKELFQTLHNLKILDLSFNKLRHLSHDIFELLQGLETLHINDNELGYVHPSSIGNLTALHTLHLSSNDLVTLHETTLPLNMSTFRVVQLQVSYNCLLSCK